MKIKRMVLLGIGITSIMFATACGSGNSESKDSDVGSKKEDNLQSGKKNEDNDKTSFKIDRKAPQKMDDMKVSDITRISTLEGLPPITLKDDKQLDEIKRILADMQINQEDEVPTVNGEPYEGGTNLFFYNNDECLFEIIIVGPDDIGRCTISNDEYSFMCDISEEDVKTLRSLSDANTTQ